ncbi:MAG: transposase, partial [bacterium]|nr:transposase [bacterium]
MLYPLATNWLLKSKLQSITLDVDSTVKTVYGHQQGAAKGYNPHKPGAKSYHPLLAFVSELKLVVNSWFRTGSAYT